MKAIVALLPLVVSGCMKPIPPEPTKPIVIEVRLLPAPVVKSMMIEVVPDPEPPIHTWMTGEELQKVLDARAKENQTCTCLAGDPLCGCLEGEP